MLFPQTFLARPSDPRSTSTQIRCPNTLPSPSLLPPLLILPPTPNHLPLLPHHQLPLLPLLPLNRSLQKRIVPRQIPKRVVDHVAHPFDLRLASPPDVGFGPLGLRAGAGAAGEGEGARGRIACAGWEVWVWGMGGVCGGGVVAGEVCCGHCWAGRGFVAGVYGLSGWRCCGCWCDCLFAFGDVDGFGGWL